MRQSSFRPCARDDLHQTIRAPQSCFCHSRSGTPPRRQAAAHERTRGAELARGKQPRIARVKQHEADRYRKAADDALQQLDWAIGYLHGIRKVQIARALARNRAHIRRELPKRDEQPVPTQTTNQT
jgi:hypothetical protein